MTSTIPIEEVARTLNLMPVTGEPDWARVLSEASMDARFTFRTIQLEPRAYVCQAQVQLGLAGGRPLAVVGSGPCDRSSSLERGAALFWPRLPPGPAIVCRAPNTQLSGFKVIGPSDRIIERGPLPEAIEAAVKVEGIAVLRDLYITRWRTKTAAVALYADGKFRQDVSCSRLERVRIDTLFGPGAGFRVQGPDGNIVVVDQCEVTNNHEGPAFVEDSFLGCLWIACHPHPSERCEPAVRRFRALEDDLRAAGAPPTMLAVALTELESTRTAAVDALIAGLAVEDAVKAALQANVSPFARNFAFVNRTPPYVATGDSSRGMFLWCYMESGTEPSRIEPPNMAVGGNMTFAGGGLGVGPREITGATVRNPVLAGERFTGATPQRLFRVEVEVDQTTTSGGKTVPVVDFLEARYDGVLKLGPDTTLVPANKTTYGYLRLLWKNAREVWKTALVKVRQG